MPIFAVTYRYTDDTATRDRVRAEHRTYLRRVADDGALLASGPYVTDETPGALLLFRCGDRSTVAGLVADDPFSTQGVVAESVIQEWDPVIGPLFATS